jgi:surface protein
VNNMADMFWGANLFNGDISKWDVSSATDMKASKMDMFTGSSGSISQTVRTATFAAERRLKTRLSHT